MKKYSKKDLEQLHQSLEDSISKSGYFRTRMEEDADTRFCWWAGQSSDGRKWGELIGKDAFPWEGASDARIRLAEEMVNEDVRSEMQALARSRLRVMSTDAGRIERSGKAQQLLDYLRKTKMRRNLEREARLAAQWRRTYGLAFLGIFWRDEVEMTPTTVTVEQLFEVVAEGGADEDLLSAFADEEREPEAASWLAETLEIRFPDARKMVRELRRDGGTVVEVPRPQGGTPVWKALKAWVDVFFPVDAEDIQDAEWVHVRELFTEAALVARGAAEGWDEAWVDAVLRAGPVGKWSSGKVRATDRDGHKIGANTASAAARERPVELFGDDSDFFEVWRTYRKVADEHYRAMRVECVISCREVTNMWGKWELHAYAHKKYPLVALPYETVEKCLAESRSQVELMTTQQGEIKVQRDFRSDRASITVLPPMRVPANRPTTKVLIGPAAQLPDKTGGQFNWLQPPAADGSSMQTETAAREDVLRMFGKHPGDPEARMRYLGDLVAEWLGYMTSAFEQTLQLAQQYLEPMTVMRIVGGKQVPVPLSAEEIQGRFDLKLEFTPEELDLSFTEKKLQAIVNLALPLGSGRIDRSRLEEAILRSIDPGLADEILVDSGAVTQQEVEEEKSAFAQMSAGVEPSLTEGINPQLREQVLTEIVQRNPQIRERLESDELFRKMVENRMKHFQFLQQQEQNKHIGRVGVAPVT